MQPYLSGSLDEQIQLSQLPRPPPRTHEENVANGILSDASVLSEKNKTHPSKSNGRKGVDVFSRILPYWNSVLQMCHCPMHLLMNVGKDIVRLLSNHTTKQFGPKQRHTEWERGRFLELKDTSTQVPWHLNDEEMLIFDIRFSSIPFPTKFGSSLKKPFSEPGSSPLKANDYCHLLSDLGVYSLGDTSLGSDQRRVLQSLFRALNTLSRAVLLVSQVETLQAELWEVLGEWELLSFLCLHDQLSSACSSAFSNPAVWSHAFSLDVRTRARMWKARGLSAFIQVCRGVDGAKLRCHGTRRASARRKS